MNRTATLTAMILISALPSVAQTDWPGDDWRHTTPSGVDLNPDPIEYLALRAHNGFLGNVDRIIIIRHGRVAKDLWFERDYRDISSGHVSALGCGWDSCDDSTAIHDYNYFHPEHHPWKFSGGHPVHSLQSVTKSVASTVIGAAIFRGAISDVDANLLSFFPDRNLEDVDERLHGATLDDLLTMRSGIEWHESDRPLDETNTTLQLERSDDWIAFTLDQPMNAAPGEKWIYNSGGSHLMSGVIRHATGQFIDGYAEEFLFGPIGIRNFYWKKTPQGYPDTEGGLFLEALDLARIGLLILNDGVWDGTRLLPMGWVDQATDRVVELPNGWGYGYQWWRVDRDGIEVIAGLGFGDQFLAIIPSLDMVGVMNSWNVFEGGRNGLASLIDVMIRSAS